MRALSEKVLGRLHFTLEQVQDLTPTPMTLSSVMFRTGENPYTGEPVYVARTQEEKRRQKSYFFNDPQKQGAAFGLPVRCIRAVHRIPVKSGDFEKNVLFSNFVLFRNIEYLCCVEFESCSLHSVSRL